MPHRKRSHLKRNVEVAVAATLILVIAVAAAMYYASNQKNQASIAALKVGDTFTYNLTGSSVLGDPNATTPQELLQYNDTDHYQVTVTSISGTQVTLTCLWQFTNGTQISSQQIIDLSNGACSDATGFSYLYPANLNVNDLLYPGETSGLIVNSTTTQTFANATRTANCWSVETEAVNTGDQTMNTMRSDYMAVYFDKQTGMLDKLTRIDFFTNPEIEIIITWQLTSSNVWAVQ